MPMVATGCGAREANASLPVSTAVMGISVPLGVLRVFTSTWKTPGWV
jgi:hypothetical protein